MKEEDVYCEDHEESRQFNRYHRLANKSSESEEMVVHKEDVEREYRSSNYFDAIWEGRVR